MLTVVLFVVLCACVLVVRAKFKSTKEHELPPSYKGALPIIGHTHTLLTDSANLWLQVQDTAKEAFEKGGVIHLVFGRQIYYMIADPEDGITAANACLNRHFAVKFVRPWLGEGFVTSSEEIWKHHRRLMNPAFSLPVILGFLDTFNRQARKLVRDMEPYVGKGPIVVADQVRQVMLNTFFKSTFGIDDMEDEEIMQNYMKSADILLYTITYRFQTFWQHSDLLYRLSGLKKKEEAEIEKIKKMSHEIIQRKKASMKNEDFTDKTNDFATTGVRYKPALDLLLELNRDGTFTEKEIGEITDHLIITGFETLTNEIQYALMFLGINPNAQNKMYEEVIQVLGIDREVDKEDLNQLVYTNAVVMETVRMLPAIPMVMRAVDKDVKLKNYTMRAGSQCIIFPLVNQHDPRWGPSGDKFIPERWLEDPELCRKKEFAGFGLGKRGCLGRQYAMTAMKVFLAHFIRQYSVTADMSYLKLKLDFALKPVSGNEISITRRI